MLTPTFGDGFMQALQGIPEPVMEQRVRDVAPAIHHLRTLGLTSPHPRLLSAVAISLTHASYQHENGNTSPELTRAATHALNRLGQAFLQKAAAAEVYRNTEASSSGQVSKNVGEILSSLSAWAAEQEWIHSSAALSASLDPQQLPPKVSGDLFRQLLGALCLENEEDLAIRLLRGLFESVRRTQEHGIADAKTTLQEYLGGREVASYEYEKEGPDHATTFRAVVTDSKGRKGVGDGRSKKVAAQRAALDFLKCHADPALFMPVNRSVRRIPVLEIPGLESHSRTVWRVQELFSLPVTARPLISQALVHASWAYENPSAIAKCGQQNHQVLAHVGSWVLIYEHHLAIARHAVANPSEHPVFATLPDRVYDTAFYETGLPSALLLGAGQKAMGVTEEVGSNTFQALIGAVAVATGFRGSLAGRWPREWSQVWQLIAPIGRLSIDPTSRLQQAASAMKLQMDFTYRVSGPDHSRKHAATLILMSPALGLEITVKGTGKVGKTPAKHAACQVVLDILDRLADDSSALGFDPARTQEYALARFLLTQQAFLLDSAPVPAPRWIDLRLFGLHLASDAAALVAWAAAVDKLLDLKVNLRPESHLWVAFGNVIESSADPQRTLDTVLSQSMDLLEQAQDPEELEPQLLHRLVHLCDVHRCLGAQDPDVDLPELMRDWQLLYRGRITVNAPSPDVRLSGRQRAILDAALSTVAAAKGAVSVEIVGGHPMRLRLQSSIPLPKAFTREICALWSRVSRTTTLEATECAIDVSVSVLKTSTERGPIVQAVEAALQPVAQPYRAAIADLLHDLKNQLVAARSAASQPAEGRTARLQQQLAASRHLDEAHSLAQRVRAASSLLEPVGNESVDLGRFLRQYARRMLDRLPGTISLSIPDASASVRVALSERSVTAVLDNLVGNAIEALSRGGAITLAWTADEYEAVVEISDDGPGLPSQVAAAFIAGQRIQSTKPGGNGLGLLSVRSLLTRAGGQLSLASTQVGTAWLVTLPTATNASEPE